ncbi:MAG TPA: DegT/DnrJ/EryC1/StrS family aminotransferase, partial [Candidatus Sumerlaeia bacterium]|nr:DegT/DnrJ/EryC1/StrS family aminotransferase [Candidatus Sumerlaeia bacterium]
GCGIYYPVPLHLQPCFDYLGYKEGDFPQAEQLAKRVISLPVFPGLKRQEINYVAQTVKEFLNG